MNRRVRYQGLIIKDDAVLLIRHTRLADDVSYWVIPGGGIEPGESEEECVIREMKEETNLDVRVEGLLFEGATIADDPYLWNKTYLCRIISGEPAPGYEPEPEAAAHYSISAVGWFDLKNESAWGQDLIQDPFTYPQLIKARQLLGYLETSNQ
jgi:ADP-ribose pyrophosphatase YjhB (NUDIX family)